MPAALDHIRAAEANEALARHLASSQWTPWGAVATCYSAIHWVDAYLDQHFGVHPANHGDRNKLVSKNPQLNAVRRHYFALRHSCDEARYDLRPFTPQRVEALIRQRLEPLRDHLKLLL